MNYACIKFRNIGMDRFYIVIVKRITNNRMFFLLLRINLGTEINLIDKTFT